ncbi:transport and Golgi organization protein 6 homolog [Anabrus simplex]|uniref:transport and Golgi organization protein 6 homolog n=1 Tax=Anabrus simplex TaxID=316456 RepID=UPI0035A3A896
MAKDSAEIDGKLADLHCALSMLVKPADESSKGELHDILKLNIQDALSKLGIEDWSKLQTLQSIKCSVTANSSVRWQFVCITLHILLSMKHYLKEKNAQADNKNKDETKAPPDILSVNQQKTIRTCLQFVVSMGLLPSLLPGVGISLAARCTNAHNLKDEDLLLLEKYERLAGVTRGLLVCCEQQTLRNLIIANHLGDLMAALSQISFVPLKKPVGSKGGTSDSGSGDEFVMTPELWDRLQQDRSYFKNYYITFIWQVYQPLVIRELLLLHGAAGLKRLQSCSRASPPAWLKKACIQLLIHCLMRPRGVSALVRAICDSSHDSGKDWTKLETVVNLITTVHTSNPDQYNKNICTQIMEILLMGENTYTQLQVQVAVKCIEVLYKRDPLLVTHFVADVLMSSLRNCCYLPNKQDADSGSIIVSEEELSLCIINMHRLFVGLNGKEPALPSVLFLAVTPVLFNLYYKICNSVSHLKIKVEDLLMKFLSSLQPDIMGYAFKTFLFGDMTQGMLTMSDKVEFVFGESGGVQAQLRKEMDPPPLSRLQNSEEAGSCLLQLLKAGDKDGTVTTNLFMTLLHVLCGDPKEGEAKQMSSDELLELEEEPTIAGCKLRHFVSVKLLSALSESPYVVERINSDPNYLMDYFLYVLERDFKFLSGHNMDVSRGGEVMQNLIMVVMTLGAALNDPGLKGKPIDWKKFEGILEPLKMIRDNVAHEELQMLASQVYNTIVTRGLIRESTVGEEEKKKPVKSKKREKKKKGGATPVVSEDYPMEDEELNKTVKEYFKDLNPYKQAVLDVCDPLVPVHGHGLVELARLIMSGDEEAKANKNLIFKIFQDDLKCEDSYIYLLAINGLAAMANIFPATVIRLLVDEYRDVKDKEHEDSTQLRLKIGEVLVRISKSLDSNISSYSAILLNTFLNGAKDPDSLIRASSMSNLGQVCQAAGFRVGSMINEILLCVESIVKSDPSVEVRRSAVMVLTLLLRGLGSDTFKVLSDVLLQLYRALKLVYQKEKDDVIKLHVQLALDELNSSTLDFVFPQQKLEKKLYVLDAPPV